MVKVVVWGGMLVAALVSLFIGVRFLNADQGELVGYAISAPDSNNECELQVIVNVMMNARDPAWQTVNPDSTRIDWAFWANEHFKVVDSAGNAVTFRKGGFKSRDISENQAGPTENIPLATLQAGQDYTFTYIRNTTQPEKYSIPIKGEETEFRRRTLDADY